ncbi:MAG: glycosyltransferase family 4 protein [Calditrichales bacterium]|nr:glycosyltransferase family 4 protein [Calditrichales bacterium]
MIKLFVFGLRGFPNIQGGVEKHAEILYPLLSNNCNISVFRRRPFISNKNFTESIKFIDLPSTKIKGFEALYHSFLSSFVCIIKRPDIIHIHNIGPGLFIPLLKLFSLKVVLTYHSPNYEHKKWNRFAKLLLKLAESLSTKFADKVIFVSKNQMLKTKKFYDNFIFIPNGVYLNQSSYNIRYLKKYNIKKNNYIFFAGRITQEKGINVLISAYNSLGLIGHKLVIAGGIDHKSSFSEKILSLCKDNKNIVFTDFISGDELQTLFLYSSLFVLPSFNEGNPIALLEAMSYNLDVLVSDIPANLEVELNEDDYFKVGNVEDLKEKIMFKLNNPQKRYFTELLNKKYDWDKIAGQTLNTYKSVL